jgi:hypothetical protein
MHEGGTGLPPAGWYPDALDPAARRWWDGAAWTAHVRLPEPVASVPAPPAEPALSRRQLREQVGPLTQGGPAEASTSVAVLERPADISSVEYARRAAGYEPRAAEPIVYGSHPSVVVYGSTLTLPSWLIATSPLWYGGLAAIVGGIVGALHPNTTTAIVGFPVLGAFIAMLVLLARTDATRLAERGYIPPSPKWGWLPFVYLILRVMRTGSKSVGLLVTYVLAQTVYFGVIAIAFLVILAPLLAGVNSQSAVGTAPTQSEQSASVPETVTPEDRAYLLTPEGMPEGVAYLLGSSVATDGIQCTPFAQGGASTTQCLVLVEGGQWVVTLELTPDDPAFPYSVYDVRQVDGGAVQT